MKPLPEYQRVTNDLFTWNGYNPNAKCDCTSCAVRTPEGFVFIDPLRLEEQAVEDLIGDDKVCAIVLTNANHTREYEYEARRLDVPVYAHPTVGVSVARPLRDGDTVCGVLKVSELPGGSPGEIALHGNGLLILGDAVVNFSEGLQVLPDKYCEDPAQLRLSLKKLLDLDFHTLVIAHGPPLVVNAKEKFADILAG